MAYGEAQNGTYTSQNEKVIKSSSPIEMPSKKTEIENSTILLFDASESMGNVSNSTVNAPNNKSTNRKIDNAKTAVKTFISGLDPATNEVALIVFYDCGKIVIEQPFTTKQSELLSSVDKIKPAGYTPLSAAIDFAINYMGQSTNGSRKKIIQFTDGEETCPSKAIRTSAEDIDINMIGFDILKGSDQESKLLDFAKKIGGAYLDAEDASSPTALTKVLQQAYTKSYVRTKTDLNSAWIWNGKGNALAAQGKYDEAIQAYNKAIELDPQDAVAWSNKGFTLEKQGKYDEAIQAYDKAIELDPQSAMSWYGKGAVLDRQGMYDEAIQAYDEALKLNPDMAKS